MRKIALSLMAICCFALTATAQMVVKGKVVDRNNQPVEGASVKVKGGSAGTSTDKDGNYSITVSDKNAVLVFTGVGLAEQEVALNGSTSANVVMSPSASTMAAVEVVGSRGSRRSAMETPAPVDIIPISRITNTLGQVDINQILQYVAPSFNSNRQTGADGADHIDPASLRGLGPDQTLVLVNGKRYHQSALVNLYGSRGRGNSGTDLNTIPAAAIERIEILRDGAAAQYGSDAIAGVINIVLKSNINSGSANVSVGQFMTGRGKSLDSPKGKLLSNTSDGLTVNANVNYGFGLKDNGFINITGDFLKKNKTFRPNFESLYPDNYRQKFGDGSIDQFSFFANAGIPINTRSSFYLFGGYGLRKGGAFAYTRDAGSSRNVVSIYPNGFNPEILSTINDGSVSFGIRSTCKGWNTDLNLTTGVNRFEYDVDKTLNSSMVNLSPTKFYAGGFQLTQSSIGYHANRHFSKVAKGITVAMGAEVREDKYKLFAGELNSYKQYGPVIFDISGSDTTFRPGGSQGFPGYQPKDETNQRRTNWGAYVDAELEASKSVMFSAALRGETYSDFGGTLNFKLGSRWKITDNVSLRGTVSTGFRAPSLAQKHFSSTFTNVAAGQIYEIVIAPNSGPLAQAVGIPELKEETSINTSIGFTARPIRNMTLTVDAYSVNIKDRVVLTGLFDQTDDAIGDILTNLNVGAAQFFTNAVDTRTTGLDIISTYTHKLLGGNITGTFAANFNKMKIENIATTDKLRGKEGIYYGEREQFFLLASAPPHKMNFTLEWRKGIFSTNLRFTKFAAVEIISFAPDVERFAAKTTTDLSFSFSPGEKVRFTVGGQNIFDVYPNHVNPANTETGGMWEAVQMGYGGSFFFGKIGIKF